MSVSAARVSLTGKLEALYLPTPKMAAAIGVNADTLRRLAKARQIPGPAKLNRHLHLWDVQAVKMALQKLQEGDPHAA